MVTIYNRGGESGLETVTNNPKTQNENWADYFKRLATENPEGFLFIPSGVNFAPNIVSAFQSLPADTFIATGGGVQSSNPTVTALPKESAMYFSPAACTIIAALPKLPMVFFWGFDAVLALIAKKANGKIYLVDCAVTTDVLFARKENCNTRQGVDQVVASFNEIDKNWGQTLSKEKWASTYLKKFIPPRVTPAVVEESRVVNAPNGGAWVNQVTIKITPPDGTTLVDIDSLFFDDSCLDGKTRKVAFCFLLKNSVDNPRAWQTFFAKASEHNLPYSIHAHFSGKPEGFLAPFAIPKQPTNWHYTVQALVSLVATAKKAGADKVVFISDSCIPLKTPLLFWERLQHDFTMVTYMGFNGRNVLKAWPNKDLAAQQWSIVDKRHFDLLVPTHPIIKAFYRDNVHADNEYWLTGVLRYEGRLSELRRANNCFLESNKKKHPNFFVGADKKKSVKNYDYPVTMPPEKLQQIWETEMHLTGRKFDQTALTEDYFKYLES